MNNIQYDVEYPVNKKQKIVAETHIINKGFLP